MFISDDNSNIRSTDDNLSLFSCEYLKKNSSCSKIEHYDIPNNLRDIISIL